MPASINISVVQWAVLPTFRMDVSETSTPNVIPFPGEATGLLFPLTSSSEIQREYALFHSLFRPGNKPTYPALQKQYDKFLRSYAQVFCNQFEIILEKCRENGICLVVFPEYSVPAFIRYRNEDGGSNYSVESILPQLRALAGEYQINVVAGTHAINRAELDFHPEKEAIIDRLGNNDWERVAICPILRADGGDVILVFKQIRSRYEGRSLSTIHDPFRKAFILPIPDWARSQKDPDTSSFRLAVAVCSEFVREDENVEITNEVLNALENAEIVAIPAWTPADDFIRKSQQSLMERRHSNRVVFAFANSSLGGRSFIATQGDQIEPRRFGMEVNQDGLLWREVQVGIGSGIPFQTPPESAKLILFLEYSGIQRRLFACAEKLLRGERDFEVDCAISLPNSLTPNLAHLKNMIELALNADSEASSKTFICLDRFWVFRAEANVITLIDKIIQEYWDYLTLLRREPNWGKINEFLHLLGRKREIVNSNWFIDEQESGMRIVPDVSTMANSDQQKFADVQLLTNESVQGLNKEKRINWRKMVLPFSSDNPNAFNFAIQITGLPDPDYGVAYQPRIAQQLIDILANEANLDSIQIRYVSRNHQLYIFFLFRFQQTDDPAMIFELAQEVYAILEDRLLVWRIDLVPVDSLFFQDFGGQELFKGGTSTRYKYSRVEVNDETGRCFPFQGRGEANSIVNLLTPMDGDNLFSITLYRPNIKSISTRLYWENAQHEDSTHPLDTGVESSVHTLIQDLQDLQDATDALSFRSALFHPNSEAGKIPTFPAAIVLESNQSKLRLVPDTIGLELAGPGRYRISREEIADGLGLPSGNPDSANLLLAEREVYHLFRLPFGNQVFGFPSHSPKLSLSSEDVPPQEGLLLGNVIVKPNNTTPYFWNETSRQRHLYMMGKTGTGKSYLMASMISRDIQAGRGLMVIDPHGDLVETVLARIPTARAKDIVLFDPGDTRFPPGLNLLEFELSDPYKRSAVLEEAVSIFLSLYGPEIFGPRIQQYFRGAVLTLIDFGDVSGRQPTLLDVARIFVDEEFRKEVSSNVRDPVARLFWKEYQSAGDRERSEIIPYFQAKFGPLLSNRVIRNVIGQPNSLISFPAEIRRNAVILVNLSRGKIGDINANLLGMILIAKFNWAILGRAHQAPDQRQPYSLYVDEFQNLASRTFASMLSEARKYGLSIVLANQYISQLKLFENYTQIHPDHLLNAVFGNVETFVGFQAGREDSDMLAKEMGLGDASLIQKLTRFRSILSTAVEGRKLSPCYLDSIPWTGYESKEMGKRIEEYIKLTTCPPVDEIDKMIEKYFKG